MDKKDDPSLSEITVEAPPSSGKTAAPAPVAPASAFVVLSYMLFSSTMLIINKAAVRFFPAPSILLALQTAVSAIVIWGCGKLGYMQVDALEQAKASRYILVVVVFVANIFTNIKALENSNVETVIVFQTLTSLIIAYGDYKLLKSRMPSPEVIGSLGIIVVGALAYMYTDSEFRIDAYFWVFCYFVAKTTDMLYTKHIVDTVPMSNWGRSFYNNFFATFPLTVFALWSSEWFKISALNDSGEITTTAYVLVMLSCIVGIGISIAGFACRAAISATSFSVVGNMNKVLTIFINFVIWTNHASNYGLMSLCICLVGGAYYAKVRT